MVSQSYLYLPNSYSAVKFYIFLDKRNELQGMLKTWCEHVVFGKQENKKKIFN